jgi:transcriptional regulator with XRE-family HTH domain
MYMRNRIKELREARGLKQSEVAAKLGLHLTGYNQIENAKRGLRVERLEEIAQILHCEPAMLLPVKDHDATVWVMARLEDEIWTEASFLWDAKDWYAVTAPVSDRWKTSPKYAAELHGNSMNRTYPHGTVLVWVDFDPEVDALEDGKNYVVRRTNRRGFSEYIARQYRLDESGDAWLWPDSTSPAWQQPERYTGRPDDGAIFGRIVAAIVQQ